MTAAEIRVAPAPLELNAVLRNAVKTKEQHQGNNSPLPRHVSAKTGVTMYSKCGNYDAVETLHESVMLFFMLATVIDPSIESIDRILND